jgi:hypothetical protein
MQAINGCTTLSKRGGVMRCEDREERIFVSGRAVTVATGVLEA